MTCCHDDRDPRPEVIVLLMLAIGLVCFALGLVAGGQQAKHELAQLKAEVAEIEAAWED